MNNKLGIYYAYMVDNYDADFAGCVKRAHALGFDAVGLRSTNVMKLDNAAQDDLKKLADDLGISINYAAALNTEDISSENEAERKAAVDFIKKVIHSIGRMGATTLNGGFYSFWHSTLPLGVKDKRPYMERSAAGMRELCAVASDYGMTLGLEILNRYETFMLNTVTEGLQYLAMADCKNLGLHLDTYHMNIEEKTLGGAIREAGDKLVHFHLGEANRDVPGPHGHINWDEVFSALKDANYTGLIEFEPFVTNGTEVGKALYVWHDIAEGQDRFEKLSTSLTFVKDLMAKY